MEKERATSMQNGAAASVGATSGTIKNGPLTAAAGGTTAGASSGALKDLFKIVVCIVSGALFGFAAEKGRVFIPAVIQNQMHFNQFTMLKSFLSAVISGLGIFAVLSLLPPTRKLFAVVRENYGCCVSKKKSGAFALGAALLGIGMSMSGSCPGIVILQLGAGTSNSLITLAGCFAGALLYGALEPILSGVLFRNKEPQSVWVDELLHMPYMVLATSLASLLLAVIVAAEYYVPWYTEVPVSPQNIGLLTQVSWSPIVAGLLMGALQLPIALVVEDSLGGSSSYCTLLSHSVGRGLAQQILPYFQKFSSGISNWWQVAYWAGGASGAAISAYLSGTWGTTSGVEPVVAFTGGMLMLFGARLASGCTSGHGLSGLALMAFPSFIAVPMMFAGGIGYAFIS